jgi:class 3 adenylate cyclase
MRCTQCQTKNLPEARYCMDCGMALKSPCPRCEREIPSQAGYCIFCGVQMDEGAKPPIHPLQDLIPKDYADKLELARDAQAMQGERRIVTILFCDVKGSTAMAEQLDPEEWTEIMNRAFEYLITPIYNFEGTLARLMGDSVLAFFGAPIAHEDDAQRAILAGLEILENIQPFRAQIKHQFQLDFNVRVGINTGLVVVGGVGSDLFMEYTAQGDAINIAARMEQTTEPGTIRIAEATYKKVTGLFEFKPIEGVEIKGKSEPATVYQVLGQKEKSDRGLGLNRPETPLLGREKEIEILEQALRAVKQGRGQIVNLIAEVGLGKSRLLREGRLIWESLNSGETQPFGKLGSRWNQVMGVSYEASRPYSVIQQLIRNFIGVSASDAPELVRQNLATALASSREEISPETVSLFETVLGVKEHSNGNQFEGENLKRAIYKDLKTILEVTVQQNPTVIAIDDLHWSDQASVDLIQHLFQLADRLPILFICTFRPNHRSLAWKVKQFAETEYAHRYLEIELKPLSDADCNALVDRLLQVTHLPENMRGMILEKSDGNPFFLEEVIRSLIDNEVVVQNPVSAEWEVAAGVSQLTIPDNLQALITARIDRLEDTAKRILQMAAVIGRSFYHQVLEIILGATAELDYELNNLQRLGLILEAAREPDLEYAFRQALTHETAYSTILLKHRREFHRKVGEVLLQLYPERADEFATVLGHHFYEALDLRALGYFKIAGDAAFRLYANQEAIGFYSKAIEVCEWSDEPDIDQLADLYTCLGRAFETNSQFTEALNNFQEMEILAQKFGSDTMIMTAQIAQAQIYSIASNEFNLEAGLEFTEKAQTLAERLDDKPVLAKIAWIKANLFRFHKNLDAAQSAGEEAIVLARELGLEEQLAYSLTDTAHTYNMAGRIDRAKEVTLEASHLWRKLDNLSMLTDSLGGMAAVCVYAGDYDEAYGYSDEAYAISSEIENIWGQAYSRYVIGWVDFERGNVDVALERFQESIKNSTAANFFVGETLSRNILSTLYSELGHFDLAQNTLELLYANYLENIQVAQPFLIGAKLFAYAKTGQSAVAQQIMKDEEVIIAETNFLAKHYYVLSRCYVALAEKKYQTADEIAAEFYNLFRETGIEYLSPEFLLISGVAQFQQGQDSKAKNSLESARQMAERLGSRRTLWQIDYYLGLWSAQQGQVAEAEQYHQSAQGNINYILDHISDGELKAAFRAKPEVQAVFKENQMER